VRASGISRDALGIMIMATYETFAAVYVAILNF